MPLILRAAARGETAAVQAETYPVPAWAHGFSFSQGMEAVYVTRPLLTFTPP
jgi:hypothetical protein